MKCSVATSHEQESRICKNVILEPLDTSLTYLTGKIYDYESEGMPGVHIKLTKGIDSVYDFMTDMHGKYKLYLPVGLYTVSVSFIGYTKYVLADVSLNRGEHREMEFELGVSGGGCGICVIVSKRPLFKRKLRKIENRNLQGK